MITSVLWMTKLRLTELFEVTRPTESRASIGTQVSLIPKLMLLTTGGTMLPPRPHATTHSTAQVQRILAAWEAPD